MDLHEKWNFLKNKRIPIHGNKNLFFFLTGLLLGIYYLWKGIGILFGLNDQEPEWFGLFVTITFGSPFFALLFSLFYPRIAGAWLMGIAIGSSYVILLFPGNWVSILTVAAPIGLLGLYLFIMGWTTRSKYYPSLNQIAKQAPCENSFPTEG